VDPVYFNEYAQCNVLEHQHSGTAYPGKWWGTSNITVRPPAANITFSISSSSNFTQKLSGVYIAISNGQFNTTGTDGTTVIGVTPNSSAYTYSLIKTGYNTKSAQPLGGYGVTGGTLYDTMDPDSSSIPTGYTRTTVFCTDGSTGTPIVGATLNIKDVQNSSWKNGTSSATGTIIDVLASHTLDIYGSYPGVYTSSQELDTAPGRNYYLPLYTYAAAPVGYVNLFIYLRESGTGTIIKNANVYAKWTEGGVQKSDTVNTANSGTAAFVVPNTTVIIYSRSSGHAHIREADDDLCHTYTNSYRRIGQCRYRAANLPPCL
jgi:hypothetical protein